MRSPVVPVSLLVSAALLVISWLDCRLGGLHREFGTRIGWGRADSERRPIAHAAVPAFRVLARFLPGGWSRAQRDRLVRAGLMLEAEEFMSLGLMGSLLCAVLGVALGLAIRRWRLHLGACAAAGAAFGLFAIDWWVQSRGRTNAALLRGAWPHFLYRLRLCLLAGMGLERALAALAEDPDARRSTALRRQLTEVVREIRAGVSCESALARWGELTQVEEVMALASAAERSRALGLPLAASLARQAGMARDRLRQEYLGWANTLPSRLSLCAMLFFLPAILIVVLLPGVLSFLRSGW